MTMSAGKESEGLVACGMGEEPGEVRPFRILRSSHSRALTLRWASLI